MTRAARIRLLPLHPVRCLVLGLLLTGALFAATDSQAATSPQELLDAGRVDDVVRLLTPQATGNNAQAFNYLCRAYFALGDWDNAVRNCEHAAQIEPRNAIFQLWLGRSYGEKANAANVLSAYALARKTVGAFTTARSLDRHNVAIARDLGEYYASAPSIVGGGSDKALALAAELTAEHPSDAAWLRALVASNQGRPDQAESEYVQSVRLDHESASTYIELARYLRGRNRWDRFQETIDLAMKSPRIHPADRYDAAELLLKTNQNLPLATQQMRAYIQGSHTEEEAPVFRAHYLLGELLLKSGAATQAAEEFKASLALASGYRPAAEALRRMGQR